jgi:hypothetical protein
VKTQTVVRRRYPRTDLMTMILLLILSGVKKMLHRLAAVRREQLMSERTKQLMKRTQGTCLVHSMVKTAVVAKKTKSRAGN